MVLKTSGAVMSVVTVTVTAGDVAVPQVDGAVTVEVTVLPAAEA